MSDLPNGPPPEAWARVDRFLAALKEALADPAKRAELLANMEKARNDPAYQAAVEQVNQVAEEVTSADERAELRARVREVVREAL